MARICERPSCKKKIKSGKYYCSTSCAAQNRGKPKRSEVVTGSNALDAIPVELSGKVVDMLGHDAAMGVAQEMSVLLESNKIPMPGPGNTIGDWSLSLDGKKQWRPGDALSFDKISMIKRSGAAMFAVEMKRAMVTRNFSYGRFVVESPDKELKDVAQASLDTMLPKMADDLTHSSFVYGSSFMEQLWERKSKYELGLTNSKSGTTTFVVPKLPNAVDPSTIDHIRRMKGGKEFNGFVQKKHATGLVYDSSANVNQGTSVNIGTDDIVVNRNAALVVPFMGRFRDLWGNSILSSIYPLWLWYEITFRTMARYMERLAMPVALGKAPMRRTVNVEGQDDPVRAMDMMMMVAANIAKSNAAVIPSDVDENGREMYELTYLTSQERGQQFIDVLKHLGEEMIRAVIIADKSVSSSTSGSYNIGAVHAQSTAISNLLIELEILYYLNKYFMPKFSLYNRGQNGPPIRLVTQSTDNSERELITSLISIAGNSDAGKAFMEEIDFRQLGELSHIPMLDEMAAKKKREDRFGENMDHQEKQQEMMQKFNVNENGNKQFGGQPPKADGDAAQKAKKTQDEKDKRLEVITKAVIDGKEIPLVLGESEIDLLYDGGAIDDDMYQLFNPFHGKGGRFASGPGSGGRAAAKKSAVDKSAKKGGVVRTTGKVLGIGGVGVVGLAVISGDGTGTETDITFGGSPEEKAKRTEEIDRNINELTQDWPKFSSEKEAVDFAVNELRGLGVEVPGDIKYDFSGNGLKSGEGGVWDFNTNTMILKPDLAKRISEGDPAAIHMLAHEVAHSGQEFVGDDPNWGNNSEMVDDPSYRRNFSDLFEGQNDLVTSVAMSNMYGKPMANESSVEMSNRYAKLKQDRIGVESGVTLISGGRGETLFIGYQPQAELWAGIANAGARQAGVTPRQFLLDKHKFGFSPNESHQVLVDIFPEEMDRGGYYKKSAGIFGIGARTKRKFPSQAELRKWMDSRGYIDPKLAYKQMLEEASR